MVDNSSGVRDGLGKKTGWVPWLIAALLVMGGLTALDLTSYRDDIHDESEDHSEETEDGDDTDLIEPGDEDAEADADS